MFTNVSGRFFGPRSHSFALEDGRSPLFMGSNGRDLLTMLTRPSTTDIVRALCRYNQVAPELSLHDHTHSPHFH